MRKRTCSSPTWSTPASWVLTATWGSPVPGLVPGREGVVPRETRYEAILLAARVRQRSYQRGYRTGGTVGWHEGEPKPGDSADRLAVRQEVCDHSDPCGCYAEGYAAALAEARAQHQRDNEENLEALRRVMTSFHRASTKHASGVLTFSEKVLANRPA